MRRLLPLLLLGLLAACMTPAPEAGDQMVLATAFPDDREAVGRIGPGGGPLVADRGIGGTGAPMGSSATTSSNRPMADRGIGGTGVVGVVTGFGSIFVNGLEIQYNNAASVDIDGTVSSVAALRVGQLVALQAEGPETAPYARAISVRSEVIGQIEGLELGSGTLTVAGQPVSVSDRTWGANQFGLGDWVKVSGLRRPDGTVLASRLDSAPVGTLSVRGRVVRDGGVMQVGSLVLGGTSAVNVRDGQFVIVLGDYAAGRRRVVAAAPDTLSASPADYFGPSTNRLIVQAFVHRDKGAVSMNGAKIGAVPVVAGAAARDGIAIVSLQRGADGGYVASELRYAGYRGEPSRSSRGGSRPSRGDGSQHGGHTSAAPSSLDPTEGGPIASGGAAAVPSASELDSATAASTAAPVIAASRVVVTPSAPVTGQAAAAAAVASRPVMTPAAAASAATPISTAPGSTKPVFATPISSTPISSTGAPVAALAPVVNGPPVTSEGVAPITTPLLPNPTPVTRIPAGPTAAPESVPSVESISSAPLVSMRVGSGIAAWQTSRRGGTGTGDTYASARVRPSEGIIRRMNETSRKLAVSGSISGPTIDLLTRVVTSEPPVRGWVKGDATRNVTITETITRSVTSSPAHRGTSPAAIGTTFGKSAVGSLGRPHGR